MMMTRNRYASYLVRVATISTAVLLLCRLAAVANDSRDSASAPGASDVAAIAAWLTGNGKSSPFREPFGDGGFIARATNVLFYTDVDHVALPKEFKEVPYDFIQARITMIGNGHQIAPAVLITRSVVDEPEGGMGSRAGRVKTLITDARYYYVEVAIGNMATHWMKIIIGSVEGKHMAAVLWHAQS
jgi:hypothetical protein